VSNSRPGRAARSGFPASAVIVRYPNEVGARPLLGRDEEVRTARRLEESRARLIGHLRKLPPRQRRGLTA